MSVGMERPGETVRGWMSQSGGDAQGECTTLDNSAGDRYWVIRLLILRIWAELWWGSGSAPRPSSPSCDECNSPLLLDVTVPLILLVVCLSVVVVLWLNASSSWRLVWELPQKTNTLCYKVGPGPHTERESFPWGGSLDLENVLCCGYATVGHLSSCWALMPDAAR